MDRQRRLLGTSDVPPPIDHDARPMAARPRLVDGAVGATSRNSWVWRQGLGLVAFVVFAHHQGMQMKPDDRPDPGGDSGPPP